MKKHLIIPPESSTNWLFDEKILFNILFKKRIVIMDQFDYDRYDKLSKTSEIDFAKYYLLTLLRRIGHLSLCDYRKMILDSDIRKSNLIVDSSAFAKFVYNNHHDQDVLDSYQHYSTYIKNKKPIIKLFNSPSDKNLLLKELSDANEHLDEVLSDRSKKLEYIKRLSTKILAADIVARHFKGKIFDSKEYLTGYNLLVSNGKIKSEFANELYNPDPSYLKIENLISSTSFLNENNVIPGPIILMQEIKNADNSIKLLDEINNEINSLPQEILLKESLKYTTGEVRSLMGKMRKSLITSAVFNSNQVTSYLALFLQLAEFSNLFSYNEGIKTIQLIRNASYTETQILGDINKHRIKKRFGFWSAWFNRVFRKVEKKPMNWNPQRSMKHWLDDKRWFEVIEKKS